MYIFIVPYPGWAGIKGSISCHIDTSISCCVCMLHLITNKTKTIIPGNKGCHTSLQKIRWLIWGRLKIKLENEEPTKRTIKYVKWYAISNIQAGAELCQAKTSLS